MKKIKCAFTVDFEDWYQGLEIIPLETWGNYEARIERNCHNILEILNRNSTKATFFVLGYLAEKFPGLIKMIHNEGHEIGSHGFSHSQVFRLTPDEFDNEIKRTNNAVADAIGKKPIGFRAPIFSIIKKSFWAFDILAENGFVYDSSIFPVLNYRYRVVSADRFRHIVNTEKGNRIIEIPVSTARFMNVNLPIGGGAYFRIWPYIITKWGFNQVLRNDQPGVFYMHPWEIDAEQPKIKLPLRLSLTHYTRLKSTERNLDKLLKDFEFSNMADIFGFDY